MPHTTRQNYKKKLLLREELIEKKAIQQVAVSDSLYDVLEKEERDKRALHKLIAEVGGMAIDLVRKMDEHSTKGGMQFLKCEEINDDKLPLFDVYTCLDRVFDIMMTAEERIDEMAEALDNAEKSTNSMSSRSAGMLEKIRIAQELQNEMYNVGKSPTDSEILQFEEAERTGIKYIRTFADRSLQTHTGMDLEESDDEMNEPKTPPQIIVKKPTKGQQKKN